MIYAAQNGNYTQVIKLRILDMIPFALNKPRPIVHGSYTINYCSIRAITLNHISAMHNFVLLCIFVHY